MSARFGNSAGTLIYTVAILGLITLALCMVLTPGGRVEANSNAVSMVADPSATFPANAPSLGAIPDSDIGSPVCQNNSTTFRDVTFTVSGLAGNVATVAVNFNAGHTFLQDLEVSLRAPGGAPSHLLFSATGTTSTLANSCAGSSSDLSSANTYTFADTAAANWWTTALTSPVPTSSNRTVITGIGGASNPPATTSLNTTFAGLTPAQANGTWSLRFRDRGAGDTGSVTAANLIITTAGPPVTDALGDFDADGKTDYSVLRNAGGINGQITWLINRNATNQEIQSLWGLGSDWFLAHDFDGDGKDDIAVWRPDPQATFFIIESFTNTVRKEQFGLAGDNPSVVGDYNNNGVDDLAVYREGVNPGDLSYWYVRTVPNAFPMAIQWGLNGDAPAPGDYDGDGRMDFAVQRSSGPNSVFYIKYADDGAEETVTLGTSGDLNVPGDYDGDSKTDLAVVTAVGGFWQWTYRPSLGGANVVDIWGLTSDLPAPGDYNGDGKADYCVWRFSALSTFYVMTPVTRQIWSKQWGLIDDVPLTATYVQ